MAWGCGLKYLFSLQQAGICALRSPDELSRLEMVQRLAKDGYRFLQNQNYRLPERSPQNPETEQEHPVAENIDLLFMWGRYGNGLDIDASEPLVEIGWICGVTVALAAALTVVRIMGALRRDSHRKGTLSTSSGLSFASCL
ncbi:hypothetical protein DNTS_003942 [Danionella cerebrum]|uniref:Uncharacterized protein n=1 Tax=Danionella cerebrum TaxID=2873325 RepID=A0A553QBS3_9TELE|nr:hypothetical protein DNTS_003942 [Danionella translucida]